MTSLPSLLALEDKHGGPALSSGKDHPSTSIAGSRAIHMWDETSAFTQAS
jgi:hypothetical protein